MDPPEDPLGRLHDLLKTPDDLTKLPSLKSEFTRKKAAVDAQLKANLGSQLASTHAGMTSIADGQKTVQLIREDMANIDRLCSEAQGMIRDFPEINRLSVMQRNFAAVESMKASVDGLAARLRELEEWLREDDAELEAQPNLLAVHEGLSGLRDVRDAAMEQVSASAEAESGVELMENLPLDTGEGSATLRELFARLDGVVAWFDEHVGQACMNLIQLVQMGNTGLVVRLGLVIAEEERKDRQVRALREAQREFAGVADRFKTLGLHAREERGYKKKFLQAIEASASAQFDAVKDAFDADPERLEKSCRWFFNDLNTVKLGLTDLFPPKWNIFRTYTRIYHRLMHDFLTALLDDPQITPIHMLAILNWVPKYYDKMRRLGPKPDELAPHVIDARESDLVREYRSLITTAVEEWMSRLGASDRRAFAARDESSLDQDADGHLHTKSLGDMWTMLREQLAVAQASSRTDVVEGVVDAMIRALRSRQTMWESLLDAEFARIASEAASAASSSLAEIEGVASLQDWLVAVANDQITNIDDSATHTSFVTRFRADVEPLVSPAYILATASPELERLTNGYIDLASHCMHLFASLLFLTDFRSVTKDFFTPQWYAGQTMRAITTTFEDYLAGENNVVQVLHASLRDILVEEMSEALLVAYLGSVRNKGAKFRRSDPFTNKIREDVLTVFDFFSHPYPDAGPDTFELVKEKWRVVSAFQELIGVDKAEVVNAFERLREGWWDLHLSWVEAVLRARDDFERGMLTGVKGKMAGMEVERGRGESVLGKVK